MKVRTRPIEMTADQFLGGIETNGYKIPKHACYCSDGMALKPSTVEHAWHIHGGDTLVPLNHGDWIVVYLTRPAVYSSEDFNKSYDLADEPIFTVLGRDPLAQATVVHWCERAKAAGVSEEKIERAKQRYGEIVDFQSAHPDRVKTPD